MTKTLRILLIALAAFSMTACWEKKTEEAPAGMMDQEMEQPMDEMDPEVSDEEMEEMEEEIPEN